MREKKKHKYNNTSNFLLPLTGFGFGQFKPYLYNAYLSDMFIDKKYKYCIFVLLNFTGSAAYDKFEDLLRSSEYYKTDYPLVDTRYTMFVLEVLDEYKKDAVSIIEGKYSEITHDSKKIILAGRATTLKQDGTREKSILSKVLTKDKSLKEFWERRIGSNLDEQEVWSRINIENEVFNQQVLDSLSRAYKIKPNDRTEENGVCERENIKAT